VTRAPSPVHGKTSAVRHDGSELYEGIPSPFTVARYHSLTVAAASVPASLLVTATAPDGTVQGLRHRELPIHGVQFHPESVASEHGHRLLGNFLNLASADSVSRVPVGA
jgi:anthranilate synthase component 2